jgi:predicted TIM-barrel fold metal-dependent hydrolase
MQTGRTSPLDPSRRELLKTLAAVGAALPAGLLRGQANPAANPRRIDVHHHHRLPAAGGRGGGGGGAGRGGGAARGGNAVQANSAMASWTPAVSIEHMDKNGIAVSLLSLTQQSDLLYDGTERGQSFARQINDYGAKIMQDYPGRFGLFASLPLPGVDVSLKEIDYAYGTLKADGISLYTSIGDKYVGDAAFIPVLDELNRRNSVIFLHPVTPKGCHNLVPGVSDFETEVDFDTTRAVTSLMASGTLSRCQNIRFILCHAGGTFPVLTERIRDYMSRAPNGPTYESQQPQRFYFDIAHAANPISLGALMKFVPPSQLLFGTDFPPESIESTSEPLAANGLSVDILQAINRGNAEKLFPRLKA